MQKEEPMDIDVAGEFEKFDDLLEEGEYVEPNRVTRKNLPIIESVIIYLKVLANVNC